MVLSKAGGSVWGDSIDTLWEAQDRFEVAEEAILAEEQSAIYAER